MTRVVKLGDRQPLVLHKAAIPGSTIAVCRCGLSQAWPLCDGSHTATRSEEDDKLYLYERVGDEGKLVQHELRQEVPGNEQRSRPGDPSYG